METTFLIIVLLTSMLIFFKINFSWGQYRFIGSLINAVLKLSSLFMMFYSGVQLCKISGLL